MLGACTRNISVQRPQDDSSNGQSAMFFTIHRSGRTKSRDSVCYNRTRFHGGYSSMVERRSVAPDGVGSSPTTHPKTFQRACIPQALCFARKRKCYLPRVLQGAWRGEATLEPREVPRSTTALRPSHPAESPCDRVAKQIPLPAVAALPARSTKTTGD